MEKERREEAWENEQAEDAEANGNEATAWAAADLAGSMTREEEAIELAIFSSLLASLRVDLDCHSI